MSRIMLLAAFAFAYAVPDAAYATESSGTREFKVAAGGKLTLNLDTGGGVKVSGTGGSSVTVTYRLSCSPECDIRFDQSDTQDFYKRTATAKEILSGAVTSSQAHALKQALPTEN